MVAAKRQVFKGRLTRTVIMSRTAWLQSPSDPLLLSWPQAAYQCQPEYLYAGPLFQRVIRGLVNCYGCSSVSA